MGDLLLTARDVMTQGYLAVRPSLPLLDAVGRLKQHSEDTAFVLDEHDHLLGVLTEKESLRTLAARAYDAFIADTVADALCPAPAVLSPSTDAYAITQAFLGCSCGMLPVLDHGRLVGGVTQIAMLRLFLDVFRRRTSAQQGIEQAAGDMKGRPASMEQMQRVAGKLDRQQLASLFRQTVRRD